MSHQHRTYSTRQQHQQTERGERIHALMDRLSEGVAAIQSSPDFVWYLRAAAKFHGYSYRNILLILLQRPDATLVAGYKTWQALGRNVRRGEHGITIFAPIPYTTTRINDETGEAEPQRALWFRPATVFDISQTDGEPIPQPVEPTILAGDDEAALYATFVSVAEHHGLTVTQRDPDDADQSRLGCYSRARRLIYVRANPPRQMLKTLIHELSHHLDPDLTLSAAPERETVAEAAAFIVADHFGIDTGAYSFPYIAGWSGSDDGRAMLTRVMHRTQRIADALITAAEAIDASEHVQHDATALHDIGQS